MSNKHTKKNVGIIVPRRAPKDSDYTELGRWPGGLYYKRPGAYLTPASSHALTVLASCGATWDDVQFVADRAYDSDLAAAAELYIAKGHGDRYALRYTRYVPVQKDLAAEFQDLFCWRANYAHEPSSFNELRRREADRYITGGVQEYRLSWPGQHRAILESLTPNGGALSYVPTLDALADSPEAAIREYLHASGVDADAGTIYSVCSQGVSEAAVFVRHEAEAQGEQ